MGATGSADVSGPGGIADDSGVDDSARTTLGTGPACASRAARSRLRAVLKSISQRIM